MLKVLKNYYLQLKINSCIFNITYFLIVSDSEKISSF